MIVRRIPGNPIIHPATPGFTGDDGENINGPSLIRVPDWIVNPLGKYYLYFAHHGGTYIRLAYADNLAGPWKLHDGGVLHMDDTAYNTHIASPDILIDDEKRELRMYFHGLKREDIHRFREEGQSPQRTSAAFSKDGLSFTADTADLGPFYFRVFRYNGRYYCLCKPNNGMQVFRSKTGTDIFEKGPLLNPRTRHTAVSVDGGILTVFYTDIGDAPELIYRATVDLSADWQDWKLENIEEVMRPAEDYEGAMYPVEPSKAGPAPGPVNQLRDPALYHEDGKIYLLYSVAGEQGIALCRLEE